MLIAIAADLHDNLVNWQKFKKYAEKQGIKTLLFCGDLTNEETLQLISTDFKGKIFLIAGNQELYDPNSLSKLENIKFLGRYDYVDIENKKIGLIHEPSYQAQLMKKQTHLNYLFYGHTHKPWLRQEGDLIIANPGTLGGVFYKASFAILDTNTNKLELKILESL